MRPQDRARRVHPDGRTERHERRLAQQREVRDVPHGDAAGIRWTERDPRGREPESGEDAAHALRRVAEGTAGVVQVSAAMRWTFFVLILAVMGVTSAATLFAQNPSTSPAPQGRGGGRGRGPVIVMALTSPAFVDGARIPDRNAQMDGLEYPGQ